METKPRILYLLKILQERTDEEHPLSTNQIIEILDKEYGISTYRTTISKDVTALQDFGIDVIVNRSSQLQYFIGNRDFETAELKILIDAVESSKLITSKKTEELIGKIHSLTNKEQVYKLKRNNYFDERIKPSNERIYYIVDFINEAINNCKQISFQYFDYVGLKKKVLKNKGEVYTLSPYSLIWNGDYYYVVGYSNKKDKIVTFRVDRIASVPEIINENYVPMPSNFNVSDYSKQVFSMYDGEEIEVDLKVHNSLLKTMIDRFGEDVTTLAYDMESFRLRTTVSASPTFYGWVFSFSGKIQILGPDKIKEEYKQMIINATQIIEKL